VRRDLVAALQPYVMDAVICAPERRWLGAMVWLNIPGSDAVHAALTKQLQAFNEARQGSGGIVARLLVLHVPPSPALGEITDKRSINQRRVLENRSTDVDKLYADTPAPEIIVAR